MEEFVEYIYSFGFAKDLVVNDEDEEEIDFETLGIENSNENDESEINEKDEETVTLDDPITSETKKVPVVIIDWFMILKAIKKSKMVTLKYNWGKLSLGKTHEIFSGWRVIFPDEVFPDKVYKLTLHLFFVYIGFQILLLGLPFSGFSLYEMFFSLLYWFHF